MHLDFKAIQNIVVTSDVYNAACFCNGLSDWINHLIPIVTNFSDLSTAEKYFLCEEEASTCNCLFQTNEYTKFETMTTPSNLKQLYQLLKSWYEKSDKPLEQADMEKDIEQLAEKLQVELPKFYELLREAVTISGGGEYLSKK